MQELENHGEMQDPRILLAIRENQVVESCDTKSASKVEEMDDSHMAGTSTRLQVNERNDSKMSDSEKEVTHHHQKYPRGSLLLKKVYSYELSGFVKSSDTWSGVYTALWSDDTEDLLTEFPIKHLIVDSPDDDISKQN